MPRHRKPEAPIPESVELATIDTYMDQDPEVLKDMKRIEEELEKTLHPEFVQVLKRLAYYLSDVGLEFNEACIMVRFDPKDMLKKIKEFPIIQDLISVKELEYKTNLIKSVSKKALKGDDKMAMWLLERRFPAEFNPKKGTGSGKDDNEDFLGLAVEYVRKQNMKDPLVREESGRAFIMKKTTSIPKNLNDLLA